MTNNTDTTHGTQPDHARRKFLLLIPAAVSFGILTTMLTAALRFLRPRVARAADDWLPVARTDELHAAQPVARSVRVVREAGWAQVVEEHPVFVLPTNARVVSAVCPHEGCTVIWRDDERGFLCPCHDSHFDAAGARKSGPAARDLDTLPSRIESGVLKVQLDRQA